MAEWSKERGIVCEKGRKMKRKKRETKVQPTVKY